jgi:hypothetical protein
MDFIGLRANPWGQPDSNYLDIGGATSTASRYFRVRLVP